MTIINFFKEEVIGKKITVRIGNTNGYPFFTAKIVDVKFPVAGTKGQINLIVVRSGDKKKLSIGSGTEVVEWG